MQKVEQKAEQKAERKVEQKVRAEGKTEEKNAIALKMRQAGLPIEQIMQFTGLSEENIKSLIQSLVPLMASTLFMR